MAKKLTKPTTPTVPEYKPVSLPAYQPIDYAGTAASMLPTLQDYGQANLDLQVQGQDALTRGAFNLTKDLAPQLSALRQGINDQYSPLMVQSLLGRINQADPEFLQVRQKLGQRTMQGLDDGYSLGDELGREVEQSVRRGQTARGNWLGPAPTAAEAFSKASAGIDLYNQRMAQGNQFLQSRGAGDLFGAYAATTDAFMQPQIITPGGNYIDPGLPLQAATAEAGNRNSYAGQTLQAYQANNQAQFMGFNAWLENYDRQWDRYLYSSFNGASGGMGAAGGSSGGGFNLGGAAAGGAAGALSGAAAGATLGTMIGPGYGTGIGAAGGAIMGGLGFMQGGGMMG